jgi:hypothetical protein
MSQRRHAESPATPVFPGQPPFASPPAGPSAPFSRASGVRFAGTPNYQTNLGPFSDSTVGFLDG